ncbi:cytochrome o ubiquinol oxidase subunit IV [Paenibacillus chitinolyticus]|uniref:Cytochrome o ubiquinol oxidase subunit IV n=1 Tax=Paenibacillus chitinolyticus TaxID=79263 RepID=A0A410WUM9_9BACL|nr:cytochrome o ubiquinol oxidase subunit IV [Paenibacillus chitinolyticus]MCY9594098.1 cytochrome o ubiquinol oxidase subunit IV [Paenibacillus chitinolyticus]MCY9596183.1 cytochrome o ubiquinol oxidase subunit IV [Paenibacillus chitinolyticus]QAV18088.1 cytochrome o ubiquinol oxidase subunit IV [Paenibacillus chitinolyticus]
MAQHTTHSGGAHDHEHHESHGSLKSYVIGFLLSIVLTIIPLVVILNKMVTGKAAILVLLITAVLQFAVQLLFFMHLTDEKGPRYNLLTLILGLVILTTIVAGSIWIMTYNTVAN